MDEKAKAARRVYNREWQRRNKEKVKRYQERYWIKKARILESGENDERENKENETGK